MRVATLIIGLILTLVLFIQSLTITAAESIDDALNDRKAESENGSLGVLVSLLYLVASALVIAKPRFSMWTFAAGGVVAIIAGAATAFSDLIIWGIVGLVLAVMSWRGSVEKQRKDAEERAGREALQTLAAQVPPKG